MSYPGILTRAEFATGLLVRSVKINGYYLFVDNCTINQTQPIDASSEYIQGGPGTAIAFFDANKITGNLSFPLRVDINGQLESAAKEILRHAQNPYYSIHMDTNHLLLNVNIKAEDHATDNNVLIRVDKLVISSLTIKSSPNDIVQIEAQFEGMIDNSINSDYSVPNENDLLGRALTWGDCSVSREESSMRAVTSFDIKIENNVETPVFLIPYQEPGSGIASTRSDQISLLGIKSVKWSGSVNEFIRNGSDLNTYIHGGWMIDENLNFTIGPMTVKFQNPLFKISQLPLTAGLLTRTTEWTGLIKPTLPLSQYGLITFD